MTDAEAMERARDVLPTFDLVSLDQAHEAEPEAEDDEPAVRPPSAAIVVTGVLPFARALALYREARALAGRTGLAPLILEGEEALSRALDHRWSVASRKPDPADAMDFFAQADGEGEAFERRMEAALDRLAEVAGRDPMSVLHRLEEEELAAIESGDGAEIDFDDLTVPDDREEAYALALADREAFLASARGVALLRAVPTWSVDTALDRLVGNPARLVLVHGTPAAALEHLGFGGFNACPGPHVHARVWERWGRTYGAEPVVVGSDAIGAVVARPPEARASLVRYLRELAIYDRELFDAGLLPTAGRVFRNTSLGFWWD